MRRPPSGVLGRPASISPTQIGHELKNCMYCWSCFWQYLVSCCHLGTCSDIGVIHFFDAAVSVLAAAKAVRRAKQIGLGASRAPPGCHHAPDRRQLDLFRVHNESLHESPSLSAAWLCLAPPAGTITDRRGYGIGGVRYFSAPRNRAPPSIADETLETISRDDKSRRANDKSEAASIKSTIINTSMAITAIADSMRARLPRITILPDHMPDGPRITAGHVEIQHDENTAAGYPVDREAIVHGGFKTGRQYPVKARSAGLAHGAAQHVAFDALGYRDAIFDGFIF